MPGKETYNEEETVQGDVQLPMYDFFLTLKQNGFLVTPAQIADSHTIIARYAGGVANESDLCNYLCPLFSSSEEDQEKFKALFDQYYNKDVVTHTTPDEPWKFADHLKLHWWKYLLGLVIIVAIVFYFNKNRTQVNERDQITLQLKPGNQRNENYEAFQVNAGEKLEVYPELNDAYLDSVKQVKIVARYNWGDDTILDRTNIHTYTKKGIYTLTAFLDVYYGNNFQYLDTIRQDVKVCDEKNQLSIQNSLGVDSVKINQRVRLTATISGKSPDSIQWSIGSNWISNAISLDTAFITEGLQQVTAVAVYDSIGSPCTIQTNTSLFVYDPARQMLNATISAVPNANQVALPRKVKPRWFIITGLVFLASFTGMTFYGKWNRKVKKQVASKLHETERQYTELVSAFAGKKPPFDLPFRSKNYLPLPEPALNEVAWQMRRRIDDDATHLHLNKTIARAVRNSGFFQPVRVPRTHQSEYLFLIDETVTNNQQVKLFEFLVEQLRKQNVFIDRFYYKREPSICYNALEPAGVTLEKLHEKYPRHILLIFGNAYQLVYEFYPVFDPVYLQLIRRWKYKAVITPLPVPDWGLKETKVLPEEIPVLPADIYGQLVLMQKIFSGERIETVDFNEFRDEFYRVAPVDFEEVDELMEYCDQADWARENVADSTSNILLQWIAALALYPRIRWELILAIGKTIVEKYGKPEELNFTNLLRIARIKWISEGQFPDYTRLELLKLLKIENEILGREAILILLKEIPEHEIDGNHFVYEEKEIQRIINEFNLYAYDPVKYAHYEGSKWLFEKLWKEKKILDGPAKVYLKNESKEWGTLVNRVSEKHGNEPTKENIPLEEYITEDSPDTSNIRSAKLWIGFVIALIFLGSLLGLLFFTILNFINTDRLQQFTYQKPVNKNAFFTFKDSSNAATQEVYLRIDTMQVKLVKDRAVSIRLPFNDALKILTVSVDGQDLPGVSMKMNQDGYNVLINAPQVDNQLRATIYLNSSCESGIYDYRSAINDVASNIIVKDSIVNASRELKTGNCPNRISYGNNIDINLVNNIIANFKKGGTMLTINPISAYPVGSNDLAIYFEAAATPDPVTMPVMSIKISDTSLSQSVKGFVKYLASQGYNIAAITVANYNYNSQVNYYDRNLLDQAKNMQRLYRNYYPKLPIPVKLVLDRTESNNNQIDIWIKKLDEARFPLRLGAQGKLVTDLQGLLRKAGYKSVRISGIFDNATETAVKDFQQKIYMDASGIVDSNFLKALTSSPPPPANQQAPQEPEKKVPPVQQQDTVVNKPVSKDLLSIAEREVGYRETPAGSNRSKYGQWYGLNGQPWSAIFVSWVYDQAGKTLSGIENNKGFANFRNALNYFRKNKMLTENPVAGDIVIIMSPNTGNYTGGIFKGYTRAIGGYSYIMGNGNEKGSAEGDAVVDKTAIKDGKTTFFIHIPERLPGNALKRPSSSKN